MTINGKKMNHGYVVSDLHMFTKWTSVEKYMCDIRKAASDADFFVLNGDIFDFRWSTLGSASKTAKAAIQWFKEICSEFPKCTFIYILGNHDAHTSILAPLAKFADSTNNFIWHESFIRIGSSLFMHGDLIFTMRNKSPFTRTKFKKRNPVRSMMRSTYHHVIKMGAHNLVSKVHAKERCARYVLKVLQNEKTDCLEGVTDIYIGHTHVGFSDYKHNGYTFHNSGSAVHDLHCNMMKVQAKYH
jgi:UDP-2,3-diacylglucosamine hydrolase